MSTSQPAVLPFLVPSLPEPIVQSIYAQADPDVPEQLEIFNIPPLSTTAHISKAFQAALKSDSPVLESVQLHGSHPSSLLQVEEVHSSRGSSKITPLFVHPSGSAVAQQNSHATSATLQFTSAALTSKVLKGWPATPASKLPQWPTNQILSYTDMHQLLRPELVFAQKHADQWMDRFEAGDQPDEPVVDVSKLSNRAKKRLAAEQSEAEKAARRQARREAKAVEADGGEWTVVKKGGRLEKPSGVISTQNDQQDDTASGHLGPQRKKRKGLMVDNAGTVVEHEGKKKSKFMPADFYRSKKDDQRKKGVPSCVYSSCRLNSFTDTWSSFTSAKRFAKQI